MTIRIHSIANIAPRRRTADYIDAIGGEGTHDLLRDYCLSAQRRDVLGQAISY